MTATQYNKLKGIADNATRVLVDTTCNTGSGNAIANKTITTYVNDNALGSIKQPSSDSILPVPVSGVQDNTKKITINNVASAKSAETAVKLTSSHKINEFPFNGTQDIKTYSTCTFKATDSTSNLKYAIANDLAITAPTEGMHIYLYFTNSNNNSKPYLCVNKDTSTEKLSTTSYQMVDTFPSSGTPASIGTNSKTNGIMVGAIYGFTFKTISGVSYWVRDYAPQSFEVDSNLSNTSTNPVQNKTIYGNFQNVNNSITTLTSTVAGNTSNITAISNKLKGPKGLSNQGIIIQSDGTIGTTSTLLPLSAGSSYPLSNYLAFSTAANGKAYGSTLPTSATTGQLFFKKGSEKPVIVRANYTPSKVITANTSLNLSTITGATITSSTNLEVFHNGVLLNGDGSNYTISGNNISFTYNVKAGDTLTFIQTTPVNTIDLTKYASLAQTDAKYIEKNSGVGSFLKLNKKVTTGTNSNGQIEVTMSAVPCLSFTSTETTTGKTTTAFSFDAYNTESQAYSNFTMKDSKANAYVFTVSSKTIYPKMPIFSTQKIETSSTIKGSTVYGAVWNDYAEYRICKDNFIPGMVVCENGDDTLSISRKRMQSAAAIVSDTFGFAIGETDDAKCPIAVSGRVLAIPYESREEFKKAIGRPVCAGPNGTVSIMTDEEYRDKGYCAIGTISAVPDYATWGTGNVAVNNRIWIKVG